MSDLHHLLTFPKRPITEEYYVTELARLLKLGIPATYTLEQAAEYEREQLGIDVQQDDIENVSNTTPMHVLARSLPLDIQNNELEVVLKLMNTLFEYGAGWNFVDYENKTVGDLLLERNQSKSGALYQRLLDAGVSAELLLRKVNGGSIEFIEPVQEREEEMGLLEEPESGKLHEVENTVVTEDATAENRDTYLRTKLAYTDDALVTENNRDGVMMDWETNIMKKAAHTLVSSAESPKDAIVLNIGFGMGIIDSFIQEHVPKKHYIIEAHPDVLEKMKQEGWYEKENVIVLEGTWQDQLNKLLDEGNVFFDGIYYDTFSEHYEDMLELYDVVIGLIKPTGVFSFFNGLGADRQLCYDVYKRIVEVDVANYGLKCSYEEIKIDLPDWENVKRSYFNCNYYYHPYICFD